MKCWILLKSCQRLTTREDVYNLIDDRLWLGRRPLRGELPQEVDLVVDLAAEFPAARGITNQGFYLSRPVLDASGMDEKVFLDLVERIANHSGGVYVHCAQGHGRSAMVAAGVLMAKGRAANADQAEALVKKARPGIKLHRSQRVMLELLKAQSDFRGSRYDSDASE